MSVHVRNINISFGRPHGHHHFHCGPMMPMPYCRPFNPYYNSLFYGMNMMNMFALGAATGNSLLALMGIRPNNNIVYQQPVYVQQPMPYYPQMPVYQTPVMTPQLGGFIPQTVTPAPVFNPTPSVSTVPQTGYQRTAEKVKKIDWSKLNPFKKKKSKTETVKTDNKLPELAQVGYDQQKGKALAQDALNHANSKSTGYCARSVKESLSRTGLGEYQSGHAYQCADILSNNPNFKEVKVDAKDIDDLPAGCIVVYPRGDAGYSDNYGHIEIALGNGKAASDFVNNKVKNSDNARVFVPVMA